MSFYPEHAYALAHGSIRRLRMVILDCAFGLRFSAPSSHLAKCKACTDNEPGALLRLLNGLVKLASCNFELIGCGLFAFL